MSRWPLILLIGSLAAPAAPPPDQTALEKKAQAGDPEAQYWLGEIHFESLGVKQDLAAARKWLQQAAAQGNPKAQYRLASMLFTGQGFKASPTKGRKQFQQAVPGLQKLASFCS